MRMSGRGSAPRYIPLSRNTRWPFSLRSSTRSAGSSDSNEMRIVSVRVAHGAKTDRDAGTRRLDIVSARLRGVQRAYRDGRARHLDTFLPPTAPKTLGDL